SNSALHRFRPSLFSFYHSLEDNRFPTSLDLIEPAVASRFAAAGANLRSSRTCNRGGASEDIGRLSGNTRRQLRTASFDLPCSSNEEIERERTGARRHLLRSISQC
ncbi:hypothetical protein LINPERPRIM_LOCUS33543, partial [Linum perenne]